MRLVLWIAVALGVASPALVTRTRDACEKLYCCESAHYTTVLKRELLVREAAYVRMAETTLETLRAEGRRVRGADGLSVTSHRESIWALQAHQRVSRVRATAGSHIACSRRHSQVNTVLEFGSRDASLWQWAALILTGIMEYSNSAVIRRHAQQVHSLCSAKVAPHAVDIPTLVCRPFCTLSTKTRPLASFGKLRWGIN